MIPSVPMSRDTEYILGQCLLSWERNHIWRGRGEDFLKEVVFEFSHPGWVCFYRYRKTERGPAGRGRKVSKGVDTRGGEVKSVFEGTVNREAGFARRFQRGRRVRKGQKTGSPPPPSTTTTNTLGGIQRWTTALKDTHTRIYIQRTTCRCI